MFIQNGVLDTQDQEQTREKPVTFEGHQLLKALIGEDGGIAEFAGDGNPKDIALIVNVPNGENIHTFVCFIKPEHGNTLDLDSLNGLYEFVKGLNQDFGNLNNNEINRIFCAIDTAVTESEKMGQEPDSDVRIEVFKAQCAAYILLAEITGDTKYTDALYGLLPEMNPTPRNFFHALGFGIKQGMIKRVKEVSLGKVFVEDYRDQGQNPETDEIGDEEKFTPKYAKVRKELVSHELKVLADGYHTKLGDDFYDSIDEYIGPILDKYWKEILSWIRDEKGSVTEDQMLDVVELLHDMDNVSYYKQRYNRARIYADSEDEKFLQENTYFYEFSNGEWFDFSSCISRLIDIALAKAGEKAAENIA